MRSVLVAIDFVKDTDGSFKILELNTGIALTPISIEPYFNKTDFDTLISENNITEIDLILLNTGPVYAINSDYPNDTLLGLGAYFDKHYTGITVSKSVVELNNQVVPIIPDSPNKLIIRQCYDSTALIDETYAKDNFEFLKLLCDTSPASTVNTYFSHPSLGIDMIGDTLRNNGEYPNYIIKQRYPTTNYAEYPKVLKIDTVEELNNVKNSLPANTLLQEYIFNPNDLEEGKIKTYRTINLVYGSELNIVNLIHPFIHTNSCGVDTTVDVINNQIEVWERPKYLQKYNKKINDLTYTSDSNSFILKNDNSLLLASQLNVNDEIKSINLYGMLDTDDPSQIFKYSGTTEDVFSGSTFSSSTIQNITSINHSLWLKTLNLSDGLKFSDTGNAKILIRRDGVIRFMSFDRTENDDEVVLINRNTNQFELKSIISESYIFTNETIYTIDVENVDTFLTMDESTNNPVYSIIQHNTGMPCYCWSPEYAPYTFDCWDPCVPPDGIFTGTNLFDCYSLNLGKPYCDGVICCRVEPLFDNGFNSAGAPYECTECTYVKEQN